MGDAYAEPREIERAALIAALASACIQRGEASGICRDPMDPIANFVVVVDLEQVGQVSFLLPREYLPFFAFLGAFEPTRDGHSMTENSRRLVAYAKLAISSTKATEITNEEEST